MSIYLHIVQLGQVKLKEERALGQNYPLRQGSETPENLTLPSAFTRKCKNLTGRRIGDGHQTRANESLKGGMESSQLFLTLPLPPLGACQRGSALPTCARSSSLVTQNQRIP